MTKYNRLVLFFGLFVINSFYAAADGSTDLLSVLSAEIDPDSAQKKARMFLKGDEQRCIELFNDSVNNDNPVARIYLANTYYAMKWSKDSEKNFNDIQEGQLESYLFATCAVDLLRAMYCNSNTDRCDDWQMQDKIVAETLKRASEQGNVYAKLIQIYEQRWSRFDSGHFGTACKLKPLLDEAKFQELTYYFGASLFNAGLYNHEYELAGLKYMEESGFLNLKFCEDSEGFKGNFEKYCSHYVQYEDVFHTYYSRYGMLFIGERTILVPSRAHWEEFKKEKLMNAQPIPDEKFNIFTGRNVKQIYDLIKKHKLGFASGSSGAKPFLAIFSNHEKIGEITVDVDSKNTFDNIQLNTEKKELNPVIDFLRYAMSRATNGSSVYKIIEDFNFDPNLNSERTF